MKRSINQFGLSFRVLANQVSLCWLFFLSACSIVQHESDSIPSQEDTVRETNAQTHLPPCRYITSNGIARLIQADQQSLVFELYPGDITFIRAKNALNTENILGIEDLNREFKTKVHSLVDGPDHCEQRQINVVEAIE